MKKIAIFQVDLNFGGIQKSLVNLLNSIDYANYSVDLYLFTENNVYIDNVPKKVNIIYNKTLPYVTRFIDFKVLNKFYKSKIDKEYDIAIDFNSYSMDTALACLNVKAKKKIIWVHNDIELKYSEEIKYRILYNAFKSKYKLFDTYVAVSTGALDSFKNYHNYSNKEYLVIPNLIDTKEIFDTCNKKIDLEVDCDKYNLCSVGRLTHQKGFDILINNILELSKKKFDFHLYIIGDGPKKDELSRQIKDLKLDEYITLLGSKKDVYAYMNKMDGFILTSRYEGQGMVFLEAKALGLDIVMPKHLEKYVDNITGTNNIIGSITKLKKHDKVYDDLSSYNKDILNRINKLLG